MYDGNHFEFGFLAGALCPLVFSLFVALARRHCVVKYNEHAD
jgi:hypothetical protein